MIVEVRALWTQRRCAACGIAQRLSQFDQNTPVPMDVTAGPCVYGAATGVHRWLILAALVTFDTAGARP